MEKTTYQTTLKAMHDAGASPQYCHGWATGALENPALEEQRVTDAYTAGFEHGSAGKTDGYSDWIEKK
ncbi:MAG: hypothetical protein V3U76_04325 [Granulosicoccus sp.]